MRWLTVIAVCGSLLLSQASGVVAQRVRFDLIQNASSANDMSPDGRYVVGNLLSGGTYLWDTVDNTMTTLPPEASVAVAVADDGKTVLGTMNIWNSRKFATTAAWSLADLNADGLTDVSDFNLWNANKFQAADVGVVPEPSTSLVFLSLSLAFFSGLWRRRKVLMCRRSQR